MSNSYRSHKYLNYSETDDLIENFKYKYEEIKYLLDMKIKEFNSAEETHKAVTDRLSSKLNELEDVNSRLRHIIIGKEKESQEFVYRIDDLNQKFLTLERETENNNVFFKNVLKEKDVKIEELRSNIELLENSIDQRDKTIDNLLREKNKNSKIKQDEFLSTFENAKMDLESVKEKFNFKYNKLKEKCIVLKEQKSEKEKFIKSLLEKCDEIENEHNKNLHKYKAELKSVEQKFITILKEKDETINLFLNLKDQIMNELQSLALSVQEISLHSNNPYSQKLIERITRICNTLNRIKVEESR